MKTQQEKPDDYEAVLLEEGLQKLEKKNTKLVPGKDYIIREDGGADWWPLGDGMQAKPYRHDWIVKLRRRPHVPVIFGAQSSRTTEEQAMRILVLYFPWVNDAKDASPGVPFLNDLWQPGMNDWTQALLQHASRTQFQTEEVKRLVLNFVFTYCLPRQARLVDGLEENSDNEELVDELSDVELDEDDLLEASLTHVRGSGLRDTGVDETLAEEQEQHGAEEAVENPTKLYDLTMAMFQRAHDIWHKDDGVVRREAQERHADMLRRAETAEAPDHDLALQAAHASATAGKKAAAHTGFLGALDAKVEAEMLP